MFTQSACDQKQNGTAATLVSATACRQRWHFANINEKLSGSCDSVKKN